jgi:hypothetical protein
MTNITIDLDYEINDVLRVFPVIRNTLVEDFHFNLNDINSNDTILTFFKKQSLSNEEIRIILRKMNYKLNKFFERKAVVMQNNDSISYDKETLEEEE